MTRQEFEAKYHFENATPFSPEKRLVCSEDLAAALDSFFKRNFKALIDLEAIIHTNKYISIAPEYTAFAFKLLLYYVYARAFIDVRMCDDGESLRIDVRLSSPVQMDRREENDIIRAMRNAGFTYYPDEKGFILKVKYSRDIHTRVYSRSIGIERIESVLNEIFFLEIKKSPKRKTSEKQKQHRQ